MKSLTNRAAALGVGAAILASTALMAGQQPSSAAATAAADMDGTPPTSQTITAWPVLDHVPRYGSWVVWNASSNLPDNPVTAQSDTPDTCVVEPGTLRTHLIKVGICTVSFRAAAVPGYDAATTSYPIGVFPAQLTVHASDVTIGFEDPNPTYQVWYEGLTNGDTPADMPEVTVDGPSTLGRAPGRHLLTPSGGSNPNYAFTYLPGTLTVNPMLYLAGLPDTATNLLRLDGTVRPGQKFELAWGSSHTFAYPPVYAEGPGYDPYITIQHGHTGPVMSNEEVEYLRMGTVVRRSTTDSAVRDQLARMWGKVVHPIIEELRESNLHDFANEVRLLIVKGYFSPSQAADILAYVQVAYQWFGFSGTA